MYPVVDLTGTVPEATEPVGTKPKFWFEDPGGQLRLFKQSLPNSGEHWAEKVACELADLLGLPHASYDLALWKGRTGVLTASFVPRGGRLVLGNELMSKAYRGYDPTRRFRQNEHTIHRVVAVLRDRRVFPPIGYDGSTSEITSALGVFLGYMMLDAWIANQDRHHENWGLVVTPESTVHLTPTFDHGSSLGRNETDVNRRERLDTKDYGRSVRRYAERATSAFYRIPTDARPLSTVDAFLHAARFDVLAALFWLRKLEAVTVAAIEDVFEQIPADQMSETAKEFAIQLLLINRERLLVLREQFK